MSDESYEERAAEVERQLSEQPKEPRGAGRYVDRELPVDITSKMLRGEVSPHEARQLAHERWDNDRVRGGSMNDFLRRAWEAQNVAPRGEIDSFRERLFGGRPQGDGDQAA